MSRSGHQSVDVRDYKRPSEELQRRASQALQPAWTSSVATTPSPPSPQDVHSAATPTCGNEMYTVKQEVASEEEQEALRGGNEMYIVKQEEESEEEKEAAATNHTHESRDDCLEITVPSCIKTIIVNKNGQKISITL